MDGLTIDKGILLLSIAAVVAVAARRLRLPYTVGLVITGVALALVHWKAGQILTPDLIFGLFLPPLLFEAAIHIQWPELRRDAWPIGLLSTVGVLISAAIVMAAMVVVAHWTWRPALVFGVLIAATDPVSVIATFREAGVRGRLRMLVEAESLLNDGTSATLYTAALAVARMGSIGGAIPSLIVTVAGGVAVGLLIGWGAFLMAGRTTDPLVETALTTVAAFGSFSLAQHFHVSGVLATVSAGILMGNVGMMDAVKLSGFSSRGREVVTAFWDFAAFAANSLIFLLIGLRGAEISFARLGLAALVTSVVAVLVSRAATVYPLCRVFSHTPRRVDMRHQHVLWWGGLRGALGLALALSLPVWLPRRDAVVIATFGVVAFSTVVQGITMPAVLRRLKIIPSIGG